MERHSEAEANTVSVIIPTLNEASAIEATLDALARLSAPVEVIVVDGGSSDTTVLLAGARGALVVNAERGRGSQMHAGACVAQGEVLWFVHADTHPPPDALRRIAKALAAPEVVGGHFAIRFDGAGWAARLLTWIYPRLRWLGLCYGDSALFVRRQAYQQAGGFRPFPLFEDLDLQRRLRRHGRLARLQAAVTTSSRRFEGRSFTLTFAWWTILQVLYWLGVSPHRLARLYAPIRGRSKPAEMLAGQEEVAARRCQDT
jgi:rSAM/selenodomain-associated transferase 2